MECEFKKIINEKYSFEDLVDLEYLKIMLDHFSKIIGISVGLLPPNDNEPIFTVGGSELCDKFHKTRSASNNKCQKSRSILISKLNKKCDLDIMECEHGLIRGVTSIIIDGVHIATLLLGQIFFKEPNLDFFRRNGEKYEYDMDEYLAAVAKVPFIDKDRFTQAMQYLSEIAEMLADKGFTELKSQEAMDLVKKSEEEVKFLSSIVKKSAEGIAIAGIDGILIFVNNTWKTMHGYGEEEKLIGENLSMFHNKEQLSCDVEPFQKKVLDNGANEGEVWHTRKDGTIFPTRMVTTLMFDNNKPIAFSGVAIDITERKKISEALVLDNKRFIAVMDAINAVVYVIDFDTYEVLYINKYTRKLFGDVVGKTCWKVFHKDHDGPCSFCTNKKLFNSAGEPNAPYVWEYLNSITGKWYQCTDQAIQWIDGRIVRLEIAAEITKLKEVESILKKSHIELEKRIEERTQELEKTHDMLLHSEKLSAMGSLTASIAHEFNNPLQSVLNIIKGVNKRGEVDSEDRELMTLAVEECYRMRNLIKDMQGFNRPTSGMKVAIDIHNVLDSLLLLTKREYVNKGVVINKKYAIDMPSFNGISDQIKQVLLNLLNNALDACEKDDVVTIETGCTLDKVILSINDTGNGMDSEEKKHIFEPFYSTKSDLKGTGLGLSVSYGIIKNHGGKIKVLSKKGRGATFIIILPRR